jgi:DNA methylase
MIKRIVRTDQLTIYHGLAKDWEGEEPIDLVFTNPYGKLPPSLHQHPMIIHQWIHRRHQAEEWCGNKLTHCIGAWNKNKEAFWSANMDQTIFVNIREFVPETPGWYPEAMVRRLLRTFGRPGQTVWDGFMGRGTVGKIALELDMKYVGVEELSAHILIAREYLNV